MYSAVRIDASARLTVYSGCACDGGGLAAARLSCWSNRPRSPVGIVKGSVDAGDVAHGSGRDNHASITTSKPHWAHGHGKPSLGRTADPRRVAEAGIHRLRTDGVAVSAPPTDDTVADLAYIPRESLRQLGFRLDGDVVVRDEQ